MSNLTRHLQSIFTQRCRTNEQYSLRAFARNLSIPVSSLSEIINEKRPISKKLALKLGKALEMSPDQLEAFTSTETPSEIDYQKLALDSFYIISEWYHYGILQLLKVETFRNEPSWIAERLNVPVSNIELAMERLIRIGIIQVSKNGTLKDVTGGNTSHLKSNFTNAQLREFQINALESAIHSLRTVPIELRDNTSMTFAVNKNAIPFAKEEIKKFRRKLTKKLEAFAGPDEVYQLAISLSPLSNVCNQGNKNELH